MSVESFVREIRIHNQSLRDIPDIGEMDSEKDNKFYIHINDNRAELVSDLGNCTDLECLCLTDKTKAQIISLLYRLKPVELLAA